MCQLKHSYYTRHRCHVRLVLRIILLANTQSDERQFCLHRLKLDSCRNDVETLAVFLHKKHNFIVIRILMSE